MGGMGLIFTPMIVGHLLGPPVLSRPITNIFGFIATLNSPIIRYNPPLASHPPPLPTYPLYVQSVILQWL